ncbi:MAG: zinc ribbon domain-containing protein [Brachymonas sp.]|nr:zinc ribbon domain-containing protein [Brachymonas sp.]
MSKSLRLSEKWFRRGLWLVAFVFAGFLIGLGGTVVSDLPKVEKQLQLDDFLDRSQADNLRESIKTTERTERQSQDDLAQAQLKLNTAQRDVSAARESFNNWIATRSATQRSEQDPEVIARTRSLDALQQAQRQAQSALEAQDKIALDARQSAGKQREQLEAMEQSARELMQSEQRKVELRVFLYRLLLTLPLLAIAAWLFVKKRKGTYWPFVWGFIIFAAFAFFVELVPYLPSYGGYVRYIVGIALTAVIGRYAILALNRYLEKQKAAELLPEAARREELSYDTALARLAKSVCPGCERPVDLKNEKQDFCPHCGIGLHDHCGACNTRKSAFAKFCHACGAAAKPAV